MASKKGSLWNSMLITKITKAIVLNNQMCENVENENLTPQRYVMRLSLNSVEAFTYFAMILSSLAIKPCIYGKLGETISIAYKKRKSLKFNVDYGDPNSHRISQTKIVRMFKMKPWLLKDMLWDCLTVPLTRSTILQRFWVLKQKNLAFMAN